MRPKKNVDLVQLEKLMNFRPTLEETADWFGLAPDTIERRIKENTGLSFAAFRFKKGFSLRKRLQEKALSMAFSGDKTMLIFCLKNICGWGDKATALDSEDSDTIEWYDENEASPVIT